MEVVELPDVITRIDRFTLRCSWRHKIAAWLLGESFDSPVRFRISGYRHPDPRNRTPLKHCHIDITIYPDGTVRFRPENDGYPSSVKWEAIALQISPDIQEELKVLWCHQAVVAQNALDIKKLIGRNLPLQEVANDLRARESLCGCPQWHHGQASRDHDHAHFGHDHGHHH